MKRLSILGSTGSIGTQTMDIVDRNPELKVVALAAGSRVAEFESQVRKYRPKLACMYDEKAAGDLAVRLADTDIRVVSGMKGLIECAVYSEADTVVTAVVGMIGIEPTICAIKAGKDVALANKETLVTAGHIIMPLVKECGVNLYPVDSEHSAIFQSLESRGPHSEQEDRIERILLTASGGPFRGKKREELQNMKAADALKHPNWSMGKKVTIDSSTLVNKGLELMEACHLFGVGCDRVQVLIQPQSIIHSAVEFIDGSIIAQLGTPDMRLPIQYALFYPERKNLDGKRIDFFELAQLTFEKPDMETFKGLKLAYDVCRRGGNAPTVFNAANEYAVARFLEGSIGFLDIADMIERAVQEIGYIDSPSLEEILYTERETYAYLQKTRGSALV